MCMSVALMSPTQYSLAYREPSDKGYIEIVTNTTEEADQTIKVYQEQKMQWRGECFLAAGVFSYALAVLLGITSLPSVTNVMTWKEFAFVQSKLGWICLIFACAHDMFYGWPYMDAPSCYIPPSFQVLFTYSLFPLSTEK